MSKTHNDTDFTILGVLIVLAVLGMCILACIVKDLESDVKSLKVEQTQRLSIKADEELKQEVIRDLVRMMQQGR